MLNPLLMRALPVRTAGLTVAFLVAPGQPGQATTVGTAHGRRTPAGPRHRHRTGGHVGPVRGRRGAGHWAPVEEAADQGAQGGPGENAQELFGAEPERARPTGCLRLQRRIAVAPGRRRGRYHRRRHRGLGPAGYRPASWLSSTSSSGCQTRRSRRSSRRGAAKKCPARMVKLGATGRATRGQGRTAPGRGGGPPDRAVREDRHLGHASGHPDSRRPGEKTWPCRR